MHYNVIILAAGEGKRIREYTDMPKCLLKVGQCSILERIIENVSAYDPYNITVVAGYRSNVIRDYVESAYDDIDIREVDDYSIYNNASSLYQVRDLIRDNVQIVEADVVTDREAFKPTDRSSWVVRWWRETDQGAYLEPGKTGQINRISIKAKNRFGVGYKSCGIVNLTAKDGRALVCCLENEADNGLLDQYYDTVIAKYLDMFNIYPVVNVKRFMEVDTVADLEDARMIFSGQ